MTVWSQFWSDLEAGEHTLSLVHTKLATSGRYRCQITEAQAPFHTEQQDRNLSVISKFTIFIQYFLEYISIAAPLLLLTAVQPESGLPRLHVSHSVLGPGQVTIQSSFSGPYLCIYC